MTSLGYSSEGLNLDAGLLQVVAGAVSVTPEESFHVAEVDEVRVGLQEVACPGLVAAEGFHSGVCMEHGVREEGSGGSNRPGCSFGRLRLEEERLTGELNMESALTAMVSEVVDKAACRIIEQVADVVVDGERDDVGAGDLSAQLVQAFNLSPRHSGVAREESQSAMEVLRARFQAIRQGPDEWQMVRSRKANRDLSSSCASTPASP